MSVHNHAHWKFLGPTLVISLITYFFLLPFFFFFFWWGGPNIIIYLHANRRKIKHWLIEPFFFFSWFPILLCGIHDVRCMTFVANDDVISAADEDLWLIPRSNKTDAVELLELVNTNVPQKSVCVPSDFTHAHNTHTHTHTQNNNNNNNNIHTYLKLNSNKRVVVY